MRTEEQHDDKDRELGLRRAWWTSRDDTREKEIWWKEQRN